jgi:RNA polymerase sigma-70 factor (ECF subfamily)
LFNILHNCWVDHCRRDRRIEDIDDLRDDLALATEPASERCDIIARVRAAIARLPDGQREVVSLVDIEGFSYAEVAMILQIPTGTVTSRISRAREALRRELAELVSDPNDEKVVALRKLSK